MEEVVDLGYLAGPEKGGATLRRTVERLDQAADLVIWNVLFLSAPEAAEEAEEAEALRVPSALHESQ